MKKFIIALIFLIFNASICYSEDTLPAFPGAEGFGSTTPGGRGGRVMKVKNLHADGPGSLSYIAAQKGPRIVVFEVSGVIKGDVKIEHPYITIAGQTAPGAGITIDGRLWCSSDVHDVVIRFLRIRPTDSKGTQGDAATIANCRNVILDHVSFSWACDEVVDLCGTSYATVQWSTIEESALEGHPKGPHNLGMIMGYGSHSISIHHNLFTHHRQRSPFGFATPLDFRNNVIYNHQDGSLFGLRSLEKKIESLKDVDGYKQINVVGNSYKEGPDSRPRPGYPYAFGVSGGCKIYSKNNWVSGVVFDNPVDAARNGVPHIGYRMERMSEELLLGEPAPMPPVTTQPVEEAYVSVLTEAGCFPRDTVTKRIVGEVISGTGAWGKSIPDDLMEGLEMQEPPKDSDKDGMPDDWEDGYGLDKNDRNDTNAIMSSGYTAIEEYINGVAADLLREKPSLSVPPLVSQSYSKRLNLINRIKQKILSFRE